MSNDICANCGCSLRNAKALGTSGLYFPGDHGGFDIDLCEPCFFEEEEATEVAGTNELPDRLAHYLRTIGYGDRSVERMLARIPNIFRASVTSGGRTMTDLLTDMRRAAELKGDTYSSAEVFGLLSRGAAEIARLRSMNAEYQARADSYLPQILRLTAALKEIGEMGPHTAAWSAQTVARVALNPH